MNTLDSQTTLPEWALEEFHRDLDWCTGYPLPDGRYLGWHEDTPKDGHRKFDAGLDERVQALIDFADPADKTILELGCCEGALTVQLASVCKKVVAIDIRPKNIVRSLVRLHLHGVKNCDLHLLDARNMDSSVGRFDILFHSGLLYHLKNPVEHLFKIHEVSNTLLLHTLYGCERPHLKRSSVSYAGRSYDAYHCGELGWNQPMSGADDESFWLTRDSLFGLLDELGFRQQRIISEVDWPGGKRIVLLAFRQAQP